MRGSGGFSSSRIPWKLGGVDALALPFQDAAATDRDDETTWTGTSMPPIPSGPFLPSRHARADALECTAGSGKLILGKEAPVSRRHRWMKRISPPRWWRWWVLRMANEERWRIRPRRDGIVACESVRMGGLEGGGVRQEWERSRRSRRNAGSSRRPTSDIRKAPTGRHTPGARQYAADSSVL